MYFCVVEKTRLLDCEPDPFSFMCGEASNTLEVKHGQVSGYKNGPLFYSCEGVGQFSGHEIFSGH